jgi:iron complex transport system permease protein
VVRALTPLAHRWLIPLSACVGGNLLLLADVLARTLMRPQDLPVGLLTSALGGGYLLLRMSRLQGRGTAA